MPLLEVKDVEKTYPDGTRALRGVSFAIENGEYVAIMGPSGSGKSTLLHILGFLDDLTKGTYCFNEKTFDSYTKDEVAHVRNKEMGFVFQTFNLLARTTALENVQLPLLYSEIPERLWRSLGEDVLQKVGLAPRADHEPNELSGGERQRVAFARALINDPQIIFADEPTGNLDSKSGKVIMDLLQKQNDAGKTVVLITHDRNMAKYANRTITIVDGKIASDDRITKKK